MGQGEVFDRLRNSGEALTQVLSDLPVERLIDIGRHLNLIKQKTLLAVKYISTHKL